MFLDGDSYFTCSTVRSLACLFIHSFTRSLFIYLTFKLFSLLDDEDAEFGSQAADGFSLLMSDSVDVLNRENHADVRLMFRQRFFTENSNKLVQGFNSARPGTNQTCYRLCTNKEP